MASTQILPKVFAAQTSVSLNSLDKNPISSLAESSLFSPCVYLNASLDPV